MSKKRWKISNTIRIKNYDIRKPVKKNCIRSNLGVPRRSFPTLSPTV